MTGTQKALAIETKFGPYTLKEQQPILQPGSGQLLVKVEVVGLNPADWKVQAYDFGLPFPIVAGSDVSGVVVKFGDDVTTFAAGDRVLLQGGFSPDKGGYQEYLPANISFEAAATLPAGLASGLIGLYVPEPHGLGLTPPLEASGRGKYAGKPIVVLGGSSTVGQSVIQLAKLSGFSPIVTTASPHNEEHLKSIGATHVIDRNASAATISAQIHKIVDAPIEIVYDAVSLPDTQKLGFDLLVEEGSIILVLPPDESLKGKTSKRIINFQGTWAFPHTRPLGIQFYSKLTGLLEEGLIKPGRFEVLPGGLNGVAPGLERLKANQVSGTKLVVRPAETL